MWTRRELLAILVVAGLIVAGGAAVLLSNSGPTSGLVPFQSYAELSSFLSAASSATSYSGGSFGLIASPGSSPLLRAPNTPTPTSPGYSGTNVQVSGVDELDSVKTDGTYVYIASQDRVTTLLAYPASSMHVVSRISLTNLTSAALGANATATASGLFLDGSQLVAVAQTYGCAYGMYCGAYGGGVMPLRAEGANLPPVYDGMPRMFAFLFNVSNPADPVLERSYALTGSPSTGRMVGGTVYLVATQWIPQVNGTYLLPAACVDGACRELPVGQVYHDPQSVDSYVYTNLLAIELASGRSSAMAIVTGGYSTLYMSPSAMYLAFYKWTATPLAFATPMIGTRPGSTWTTIYKLTTDGLEIQAVASADVPGSLLNQYAMDEYQGYLRVASTVRDFSGTTTSASNAVFVFDPDLRLVGSVENLAPGESIFAVRFLEDRAYVVTYRKIDPLFVIDLSLPSSPRVSGFLEMPGFSDYLYPLDAAHLIGVGKDTLPADNGNFSWYQGLKLALYDVADPTAPSETANVTIGDRGTDSEVLSDPHAFLYIPDRQLLVLPVDLAVVNASEYPGGVPEWAWGTVVWQGVILYRVNATTGFQEVGRISHANGTADANCTGYGSPQDIRRSLYIGDVLYTISDTEVRANALADLSEIASVTYASTQTASYGCPVIVPMPIA